MACPICANVQLEPQAVLAVLAAEYALKPPVTVSFLRRGYNDTYLVESAARRYVFRVYLNGKYYISGPNDFRWELNLLQFLQARELPVSAPVPRRDGEALGIAPTDGGDRYYALFDYAEGEPVRQASAKQAAALGGALGRFHTVANDFRSSHNRYHINLKYLVEQPLKLIADFFHQIGRQHELAPFLPRADALAETVRQWRMSNDEYGVVHGDPHGGNIHMTAGHCVTIFDFDHGGYGWRAWDIATALRGLSEDARQAFRNAYAAHRHVSEEEWKMTPVFEKIRPLWDRGDVLAMNEVWGAPEEPEETEKRRVRLLDALGRL